MTAETERALERPYMVAVYIVGVAGLVLAVVLGTSQPGDAAQLSAFAFWAQVGLNAAVASFVGGVVLAGVARVVRGAAAALENEHRTAP